MGADAPRLQASRELLGALLETFVAGEIRRQAGWSDLDVRRSHYRSHDGREVDVILEDRAGRMVGIEIKAARSIGGEDIRGLRALAERSGGRFVRGVLLYAGDTTVPFAANLHAMPVSALWSSF